MVFKIQCAFIFGFVYWKELMTEVTLTSKIWRFVNERRTHDKLTVVWPGPLVSVFIDEILLKLFFRHQPHPRKCRHCLLLHVTSAKWRHRRVWHRRVSFIRHQIWNIGVSSCIMKCISCISNSIATSPTIKARYIRLRSSYPCFLLSTFQKHNALFSGCYSTMVMEHVLCHIYIGH